jgi:hypothetical protein
MKESPILFSAPMVRAIIEGRKTQTRRVVKPQPNVFVGGTKMSRSECDKLLLRWTKGLPYKPTQKKCTKNGQVWEEDNGDRFEPIKCRFGQVGDRLWVRETYAAEGFVNDDDYQINYLYRSDLQAEENQPRWKPSIFMPRAASRITLEITDVRVERLNDISENDAIAEGIESFRAAPGDGSNKTIYKNYGQSGGYLANPVDSFQSLWASINGMESWDANPYVWVIEFKVI